MKQKFFPITHYEHVYKNDALGLRDIVEEFMLERFKDTEPTFEQFGLYIQSITPYIQPGSMVLNMVYHMYMMKHWGERIYFVSSNLCEMLQHTQVNISSDFIQLPFPEIYLYLDQTYVTLTDHTGTLPVRGVYAHMEENGSARILRILATTGIAGIDDQTDINFFYRIPLESGKVNTLLEEYVADLANGKLQKADGTELHPEETANLLRLVFNTVLYLTCKEPDMQQYHPQKINMSAVKSGHKRQKKEKRLAKTTQLPFVMVGYNTPRIAIDGREAEEGRKISAQFMVSGHWRWQWKGSREDNTWHQEQILIKPYVKGSDLAEGIHKKYIVK